MRFGFPGWSLVLLLLVAPACGGDAAGEAGGAPAAQVSIEDFQFMLLPGGARIITGRLRNPTTEALSAQLQIGLYDADNLRVGTMHVLVRDVPADSAKAFRAAVDSDEAVQGARVRQVYIP